MVLLDAIMDFCINKIFPVATNHAIKTQEFENYTELENTRLDKQEQLINKYDRRGGNKESVDIDEINHEMWSYGHNSTLILPDNASESQVKETLRKIYKTYSKHPCKECAIHFKQHVKLDEFINSAKTKHEAVRKIYELHNQINEALGHEKFSTEQFQAKYSYSL